MLGPDARAELVRRVAERSFGFGPLESLLDDPDVDEVVVNGAGETGSVWVERAGRLEPTDVRFGSESELRHVIERILPPLGRRVDEAEPLYDARTGDRALVVVRAEVTAGNEHGSEASVVCRRIWLGRDELACAVWSERT